MKEEQQKLPFHPGVIPAVAACKLVRAILRRTGRGGGTALPGKVAMKFCRNVLAYVSRGMEIIVVTGTNGKTTTANMLESALTESGKDVLANKSGANLLSGVTAEFCCSASWTGKPKKHYAVIECDEGALKQVAPLIRPKVIVVTNLFRDQLDRYGEVMHTRDTIRVGIDLVPDATLVLNAEDSLVSSLALEAPNPVVYYGLDTPVGSQEPRAISDALHCIRCGAEYAYRYYTYAHLGAFTCPKCGYHRQDPAFAVKEIKETDADGSTVRLSAGGTETDVRINLPATYNIYNATAAIAAYGTSGGKLEEIVSSLSSVHSSFGRMETFELGDKQNKVRMILVKNPAGCSQTIEYLCGLAEDFDLVICLNDRTADGHDISWIWDADYEKFAGNAHIRHFTVSGDRAEDLALRLKYAGVPAERVTIEKDNAKLLAAMEESNVPTFVMPNYTSMLALRKVLSDAAGHRAFWEKQ